MSRLYIMRHGEAAPGRPDSERSLTEHGEQEARAMAAWLSDMLPGDVRTTLRIVASPYRRAQQTAQWMATPLERPVETLPIITPDDPLEPLLDWLQQEVAHTPCLLVSHMPLVGALVGRLVEGDVRASQPMPTATVAALEADVWAAGCATLRQWQSPCELLG
ncbi:phosphohistidine phosphatase SixA [Chromohalobacter marismortui]|uniref:Phosphohistidine phosphatase SixA n=1 Tax=Chromohalobacter marismortui TaxID=42055 RepID=A0A4R7NIE8_9GAMM|nr:MULTISPECIES: phosphohistidine phosphatase SixA [Chromohalobacter]MCI0511464.1 phosphohistidine phosphatase SixA [Chromohalobacter sp.]MCI0594702.1 phosphohistidine phosphatase SixA [Chromohalobacter sp.]TDU20405.1 phosphohistidine phosphatase SixA [Chromohalobacter marismortui]